MLKIKIHGATPKGGKSICSTCKNAKTVRGQNCQEIVFCQRVFGDTKYQGTVPFRVAECAEYHPINMPWLYEMEEMAWIVSARKRGPSGFQPEDNEMEVIITAPKKDGEETPE